MYIHIVARYAHARTSPQSTSFSHTTLAIITTSQNRTRQSAPLKQQTVRLWAVLQNVLMLKLKNTPFCDLKISKLLPLPYRSIPRYTNTPFSNPAVDLLLRKRLH
ncbi:hypothetical protein CDUR_09720 [Corynebacterium durum]|nr:hypothetical protein [Corynebacterium durum]WJY85668.1 hypothetical protein CDUR_09720 [Corynebacterium durum]